MQGNNTPFLPHLTCKAAGLGRTVSTVPLLLMLMILAGSGRSETTFGTWQMNAERSAFGEGMRPRSVTVRLEPRANGEVFTMDRIEADGRTTSASSILYFDSEPRRFEDFDCSGIQSARRVDSRTVEVLRMCASGAWLRWILRSVPQTRELALEVTEQGPSGSRIQRRLVLEKR